MTILINHWQVYHTNFWPLEWTVAHRPENACYAKLVCAKSQQVSQTIIRTELAIRLFLFEPTNPLSLKEKVVGFHYLGPNAGEVTQGYGGMIKLGAKKADFDNLIGIHPTTAEVG